MRINKTASQVWISTEPQTVSATLRWSIWAIKGYMRSRIAHFGIAIVEYPTATHLHFCRLTKSNSPSNKETHMYVAAVVIKRWEQCTCTYTGWVFTKIK